MYETVKKLGYQPVLLTYTKRPETSRSWYYNRYFFPDRRTPFSCSFAKTTDFLNRNGVRIVQCFDEIDLFRHAEYCDRLITGGDAVWRPAHYDSLFYLNFGEERKLRLSYSASIAHYDPSQEETYKRMFAMIENGIDYISTRERSAIQLFERIGGCYGVEPVCDPVFLLDEAQWSGFETPVPIDEKYILAYVFNDSHDYDELIEAVKKKTGVKRVIWIPTGALPERNISGSGCGVDEFIYLVHNAEAIVTNSFHGMAFSIIYKKEFFVLKRKDDSLRGDLRFSDLLSFLSLEQRMVRGVSDINNLSDIDYSFVQKLLETYTERSESWLSMALSDALGKKEN